MTGRCSQPAALPSRIILGRWLVSCIGGFRDLQRVEVKLDVTCTRVTTDRVIGRPSPLSPNWLVTARYPPGTKVEGRAALRTAGSQPAEGSLCGDHLFVWRCTDPHHNTASRSCAWRCLLAAALSRGPTKASRAAQKPAGPQSLTAAACWPSLACWVRLYTSIPLLTDSSLDIASSLPSLLLKVLDSDKPY